MTKRLLHSASKQNARARHWRRIGLGGFLALAACAPLVPLYGFPFVITHQGQSYRGECRAFEQMLGDTGGSQTVVSCAVVANGGAHRCSFIINDADGFSEGALAVDDPRIRAVCGYPLRRALEGHDDEPEGQGYTPPADNYTPPV